MGPASASTTDTRPHPSFAVHNLPSPNRAFVGRAAELEALGRALAASGRGAVTQPQAITGLGGIGKTQLALHYAYAHLNDYDLVRRLRAEEPATLAADYVGLAPALGLDPGAPDQAALVAAVRSALERRGRWLLILDNAPGPAGLGDYLPSTGTGHVLITSRERHWRGTAQPLELELLPTDDAVTLLVGPSPDRGLRAEAERLADELGRLPLALAQARAYLDELGVDIPAYRERLRLAGSRRRVLARPAGEAGYPHSVATVWQVSIEAAEGRHPAARPLLELLAFLAPDAIPRGLLGAEPEALPEGLRDPAERDEAVGALHRFFLLRAVPETLTVHRLVQAVTRDGLDEATAEARVGAAVSLANAAASSIRPDEPANWPAFTTLLPHALAATDAAARTGAGMKAAAAVVHSIVIYFLARTSWGEAELLAERYIELAEKAFGSESLQGAMAIGTIGVLFSETKRCARAEALFRRALAVEEKILGPGHIHVALRLNDLALAYFRNQQFSEAEANFGRSLGIIYDFMDNF